MNKTIIGMFMGIIAVILLILAIFVPIFTAEAPGLSSSTLLYDDTDDDIVRNTYIFTIIALIGAALGTIVSYMVDTGKASKKLGGGFFGTAMIFSFIAPLYYWIANIRDLDDMFEEIDVNMSDFWYSEETILGEISWSPSIAWYLMFVVGVITLIAMVLVITGPSGRSK